MSDEPTRLVYSVESVAQALDVSVRHVYDLIARGDLDSVKIGKLRRIPAESLHALLAGAAR